MVFVSQKMETLQSLLFDDVSVSMQDGATPLLIAAQEGHLETCRYLIEHGAAIDLREKVRITIFSTTVLCHAFGNASKKVSENARLNWYKISCLFYTSNLWNKSPEQIQEHRRH